MDSEQVLRFLGGISPLFASISANELEAEVPLALEGLAKVLGTDRATFYQMDPEGRTIVAQHQWSRPGFELDVNPAALGLPWYLGKLLRGEIVSVASPEDLPPEAEAERHYMVKVGLKSNLSIPLSVGKQLISVIATGKILEGSPWSPVDLELLRTVGQILANAVGRARGDLELRKSLVEIRSLKDQLAAENDQLREELTSSHDFQEIIGQSAALKRVLARIAQVAPTDSAVLLLGETGTGKELLARAIHERSPRKNRSMVRVNSAAIPPALVESELFGHERGAFTGAVATKIGRFELANGGTLFLDEIGDLGLDVQAKLLRVLQEREFQRVGSSQTRRADVRLVAATHEDLESAIHAGRFRADLYYRLSVFPIRVPPLRDRREDIPLLVWSFIQSRQKALRRHIERVSRQDMDRLTAYSWPGNIRELQNVVERALILSPGTTLHLEDILASGDEVRPANGVEPEMSLESVERAHLVAVLQRCRHRVSGPGNAAEILGLNPSTLRSRMKKLGIR